MSAMNPAHSTQSRSTAPHTLTHARGGANDSDDAGWDVITAERPNVKEVKFERRPFGFTCAKTNRGSLVISKVEANSTAAINGVEVGAIIESVGSRTASLPALRKAKPPVVIRFSHAPVEVSAEKSKETALAEVPPPPYSGHQPLGPSKTDEEKTFSRTVSDGISRGFSKLVKLPAGVGSAMAQNLNLGNVAEGGPMYTAEAMASRLSREHVSPVQFQRRPFGFSVETAANGILTVSNTEPAELAESTINVQSVRIGATLVCLGGNADLFKSSLENPGGEERKVTPESTSTPESDWVPATKAALRKAPPSIAMWFLNERYFPPLGDPSGRRFNDAPFFYAPTSRRGTSTRTHGHASSPTSRSDHASSSSASTSSSTRPGFPSTYAPQSPPLNAPLSPLVEHSSSSGSPSPSRSSCALSYPSRICVKHGQHIEEIQIRYGRQDGPARGGDDLPDTQSSVFHIDDGEAVTGVNLRSSSTIDGLQFVTSCGRLSPWFGGQRGQHQTLNFGAPLRYISGTTRKTTLSSLCFHIGNMGDLQSPAFSAFRDSAVSRSTGAPTPEGPPPEYVRGNSHPRLDTDVVGKGGPGGTPSPAAEEGAANEIPDGTVFGPFGGDSEPPFTDKEESRMGAITGVDVIGIHGKIHMIRVLYGGIPGQVHGLGGIFTEHSLEHFALDVGESITGVNVCAVSEVFGLQFATSCGRLSEWFGAPEQELSKAINFTTPLRYISGRSEARVSELVFHT